MEEQSQPHNQGFDEFYGILNSTDEALFAESMKRGGYTPTEASRTWSKNGRHPGLRRSTWGMTPWPGKYLMDSVR